MRSRTIRINMSLVGAPYLRDDLMRGLDNVINPELVEALGPLGSNLRWEVTLKEKRAASKLAAIGTMSFKGCPAFISSAETSVVRVRVHWAHYYVPMQMITDELGKYVEEVGEAGYEQAPGNFESTKSLVRGFMCKVKNIETVPQTITIDLDGEKCTLLVTIKGRRPRCLRCNEPGHERRQCDAPKCKLCQAVGHTREECSRGYAARAARNPGDNVVEEENMDLHEEDREDPSGKKEEKRPEETTETKKQSLTPVKTSLETTSPANPPAKLPLPTSASTQSSESSRDTPSLTQDSDVLECGQRIPETQDHVPEHEDATWSVVGDRRKNRRSSSSSLSPSPDKQPTKQTSTREKRAASSSPVRERRSGSAGHARSRRLV